MIEQPSNSVFAHDDASIYDLRGAVRPPVIRENDKRQYAPVLEKPPVDRPPGRCFVLWDNADESGSPAEC